MSPGIPMCVFTMVTQAVQRARVGGGAFYRHFLAMVTVTTHKGTLVMWDTVITDTFSPWLPHTSIEVRGSGGDILFHRMLAQTKKVLSVVVPINLAT